MMIHISDPQYVPRVGEFPDAELQYIQNSEVDHATKNLFLVMNLKFKVVITKL